MNGKTVTIPSILQIPQRIEDFLRSDDIEMVRLGAAWVEQTCPQRTWQDYMSVVPYRYVCLVKVDRDTKKYYIDITDAIEWFGASSTGTVTYSVYTGSGGYQLYLNQFTNTYTTVNIP